MKEILKQEVLEKLNESIPEADAEFKIKVRGSDCETEGEGNIVGLLLALLSFTAEIKEHLEREGMDKRVVKFLWENSFYTGMEETDE